MTNIILKIFSEIEKGNIQAYEDAYYISLETKKENIPLAVSSSSLGLWGVTRTVNLSPLLTREH